MGAWSHEPFGNDTANDWAYDLEDARDLSYIEKALDRVLENKDSFLDADAAQEAVGAIEVLAKLLGHGTQSDAYTEKVDAWVASMNLRPSPQLLHKAQRVIERVVADDSELFELWQDCEDTQQWLSSMTRLLAVVSA